MKGLFVSKEHQRQVKLKTNKAYSCIVYAMLIAVGLQIPAGFLYVRGRDVASVNTARREAALAEKRRLACLAEPLGLTAQKVEEAQCWSDIFAQKTFVSAVLQKLEQSVPENICLSEVTLHNRAAGSRDPDRIEIDIKGFARSSGPEAWQHSLESSFAGWTLSVPRIWRQSVPLAQEGLIPFYFTIKQSPRPATEKISK